MPTAAPPPLEVSSKGKPDSQADTPQPDPLPLLLTPFEQMMLAEDRGEYPMVATVELSFSGNLDRKVLEEGYATAIARHPLLRARVAKRLFRSPVWVAEGVPELQFSVESERSNPQRIDMEKSSGLMLKVIESDDRLMLQLQVHHACCDGNGILAFLQDLLLAYHQQVVGESPQLSTIDFRKLPDRNDFSLTSQSLGQWFSRTAFGIREAAKFTLRAIAPLAGKVDRSGHATGFHQISLASEGELLKGLRKVAVGKGATLNDLLLRDYLATLGEWQRHHSTADRSGGRFRLLVPCDLRTEDHVELPAANVLGYAFLTRDIADCKHSEELLENVQAEMAFIRETNASLYFLRCLDVAARVPGGIAGIGRSRGCFSTSLLSNIGDPAKYLTRSLPRQKGKIAVGELVLEDMVAYPPLRAETRAGVVLNTYGNRLSLGLACDARYFSASSAEEFGQRFLAMLQKTATGSESKVE